MGLILDTCVFIDIERKQKPMDFSQWQTHGNAYISSITVSELLVGIHMSDTVERRIRRTAFVEAILAKIPAFSFTGETARLHAEIYTNLTKQKKLIGAHDLIIAATAIAHDCAVLTSNEREFNRIAGLEVIVY